MGEMPLRFQRMARMIGDIEVIVGSKAVRAAAGPVVPPLERAEVQSAGEAQLAESEPAEVAAVQPPVVRKLSEKYCVKTLQKRLDDTRYAALLMRHDTLRSKLMSRLEIKTTYEETQKDQFRAALLVPPSERLDAVLRIFDYAAETAWQLQRAAAYDRKNMMRKV